MGDLYLILGCFGQIQDGFVSCATCENKILKVETKLDKYNEIMDYLENCRLFDRPIFEYSTIAHFIKNMQDSYDQIAVGRRLWSEKQYNLYLKFIAEHRICGCYVKLSLLDQKEAEPPKLQEKGVIIKAEKPENLKIQPKMNLKLLRSKR
jgi:hypothetical protein